MGLAEAEAVLTRACVLDTSSADYQCQLGVVLLRMGKLKAAKIAFMAAFQVDPFHEGARVNVAALHGLCAKVHSTLPNAKSEGKQNHELALSQQLPLEFSGNITCMAEE